MPQNSDIELNSVIGGVYKINASVIRLDPGVSIWATGNEPALANLGVFVHEYIHYLQNFSTYSGVLDFVCHARLGRIFSRAVNENGLCEGSGVLSSEDKKYFSELIRFITHLRGSQSVERMPVTGGGGVSIASFEYEMRKSQYDFENGPLEGSSVFMTVRGEGPSGLFETKPFQFGSTCISEGMAWEIERTLYLSDANLSVEMEKSLPFYPYRFPRAFFEKCTGKSPTTSDFVKICIMSLQTSEPGATFVDIAMQYKEALDKGGAEDLIIEGFADKFRIMLSEMTPTLKSEMVIPELQWPSRSKSLTRSFEIHKDLILRYLDARGANLFFELDYFSDGLGYQRLVEMITEHPPCLIVESKDSPGEGSRTFFLRGGDPDEGYVTAIGVYQGFMQFLQQHLSKDGLLSSSNARKRPCMFLGSCRAQILLDRSDICATDPWRSFTKTGEQCWYGAGVAAIRGRLEK